MVKSLLQHFWMVQDFAHVWQAPSRHFTRRPNKVARCCVEILRACCPVLREKGLSDRYRPGAVDTKYLPLQLQVTCVEKETTVY